MGYIDSLQVRATKIRTQQGQIVIIPNHKITENELTNYTVTGERRVDLKCGISGEADLQLAEELAIKAVESLETRIPERDVQLFYEEFGESSIIFTLRFWTDPDQKTYLTARSQAIKAIKRTFEDHGITMPYPTRTLDFSMAKGGSLREQLQGIGWLSTPQEEGSQKDTERNRTRREPRRRKAQKRNPSDRPEGS